eukprot:5594229-Amphidinium_carterae.1
MPSNNLKRSVQSFDICVAAAKAERSQRGAPPALLAAPSWSSPTHRTHLKPPRRPSCREVPLQLHL